ncbi:MAG: ATP-binding cassette domain-containing protein, partial [Acutalibacteraceae bacterium]
YLFQGTVRDNLLMGKPTATDEDMWQVLKKVNLDGFLQAEQGLSTPLQEKAANLSGGQRQRLALARAILHDSPIYIFDEATSNIDVESETILMEQIQKLAQTKTVLLVSHRLMNVIDADTIYVMEKGRVVESGRHSQLLARHGVYFTLWNTQQELEQYSPKGETA